MKTLIQNNIITFPKYGQDVFYSLYLVPMEGTDIPTLLATDNGDYKGAGEILKICFSDLISIDNTKELDFTITFMDNGVKVTTGMKDMVLLGDIEEWAEENSITLINYIKP